MIPSWNYEHLGLGVSLRTRLNGTPGRNAPQGSGSCSASSNSRPRLRSAVAGIGGKSEQPIPPTRAKSLKRLILRPGALTWVRVNSNLKKRPRNGFGESS